LYDPKKRKSWIDPNQSSTSIVKSHAKKMLVCKDKGTELNCTLNTNKIK